MVPSTKMPIPTEIVHLIINELEKSSDCRTCLQQELSAVARTSRYFCNIATPYLYSNICLRSHSDIDPDERTDKYEKKVGLLKRTLDETPYLATLVKKLRFDHELENATMNLWTSVVSQTPNLEILQGVNKFFQDAEVQEDDDVRRSENARVLNVLSKLPKLSQAVMHLEALPCNLSTLLGHWPRLETLVLGDVQDAGDNEDEDEDIECSYSDLIKALESPDGFRKSLKNVYLHDCDLDFSSSKERDLLLPSMPALDRLGVNKSQGIYLSGVSSFLLQSPVHSQQLHTLDFHGQPRDKNSLTDIVNLLQHAKGLKNLSLNLVTWPEDGVDEDPEELLASSSLEVLNWTATYKWFPGRVLQEDKQFYELLERSLKAKALPKLKTMTLGHEVFQQVGHEVEIPADFTNSVERFFSGLAERGLVSYPKEKPSKAPVTAYVLATHEVKVRQCISENRVEHLKRGVIKNACGKDDDEDSVIEEDEELWRLDNLVELWNHSG
ncbi:hypothetical protein EDC01DRAFT_637660 [Geopyxis carbonaria]|nr:hypothetical protein EDC01DRAFT_637660 [Geopyxis carbonaria]